MLIQRTAWHDLDHLHHAAVFVNEYMAVQHVRAREISKLGTHLEIPRDGLGALGGGGVAGYVRLNSRGVQVLLG